MKRILFISMLTLALPCTMIGQSQSSLEDDIYFSPSDAARLKAEQARQAEEAARQRLAPKPQYKNGAREIIFNDSQPANNPNQEEQSTWDNQSNDRNDSNYENGDLEYSSRIQQFHQPKRRVLVLDPSYSDVYVVSPSTDWRVYNDDSWTWNYSSWNNPYHYSYPYGSIGWNWRWGNGWSYSSFGWNPYWGWDGYYGYNYWNYPYYSSYSYYPSYPGWGWGHHSHGSNYWRSNSNYTPSNQSSRNNIDNHTNSGRFGERNYSSPSSRSGVVNRYTEVPSNANSGRNTAPVISGSSTSRGSSGMNMTPRTNPEPGTYNRNSGARFGEPGSNNRPNYNSGRNSSPSPSYNRNSAPSTAPTPAPSYSTPSRSSESGSSGGSRSSGGSGGSSSGRR